MEGKLEITIEAEGELNRSTLFRPTMSKLRGAWLGANVPGVDCHQSLAQLMAKVPRIPGHRVSVNLETRTLRVYDPLHETDEGKAIWAQIKPVLDSEANYDKMQPVEGTTITEATNDQIKTWLWNMRDLVDSKCAVVPIGSSILPSKDEINAMPGARERGQGSASYIPDKSRYVDRVGGEPVAASSGQPGGKRREAA